MEGNFSVYTAVQTEGESDWFMSGKSHGQAAGSFGSCAEDTCSIGVEVLERRAEASPPYRGSQTHVVGGAAWLTPPQATATLGLICGLFRW